MSLSDVYEVWDVYEYDMTDMLYSILRSINDKVVPVFDSIEGGISQSISTVAYYVRQIGEDVGGFISDALDALMSTWDSIMSPIMTQLNEAINWIGSMIETAWNRITNAIMGAVEVLATEISAMWDTVKGWLSETVSDVWGWIKDLSATIYEYLKKAVAWCWETFTEVVVPFLYGMFIDLVESEPVQSLIGYVQEHFIEGVKEFFIIDEEELRAWAKKSFDFVSEFVRSEVR